MSVEGTLDMPVPLKTTVSRTVTVDGHNLVVSITRDGIKLTAAGKRKGVCLSYQDIARQALDNLPRLRWPDSLKGQPLVQLQYLTDRKC